MAAHQSTSNTAGTHPSLAEWQAQQRVTGAEYYDEGVVVKVPLPPNMDRSFLCKLTARSNGSVGIPLDHFTYYTNGTSKILEAVSRNVLNAQEPIISIHEGTKVYIDRAFFPGEDSTRSDTAARPSRKTASPTEYWTAGEVLARAVAKQRTWFDHEVKGGWLRDLLENSPSGSLWSEWVKNGLKESSIYVVSLRRTIPTAKNIVYYFPELELRFD